MAKNSIRDFSATAGSNTDIQSVNIDENCPASGINNAIRELMVDLKNVSTGAGNLETPAADRLDVDNIRIDGNTISSTDTNGDITLDPNGTGDVVVASGKVGIGESSPATPLHISTGASTTAELRLTSNNTGSGSGDRGRIAVHSSRIDGTAYEAGRIDIDRSSGTEDKAHILFATNNASGVAERMRIDSSGNVGIGSASPVSQLTLGGTSDLVFTQNGYGIAWGGNNGSPRIFGTSGGALTFKHGGGSEGMR